MDFIGTVFATSLAVYLVYASSLSASDTGFSLNMASAFVPTFRARAWGRSLCCSGIQRNHLRRDQDLQRVRSQWCVHREPWLILSLYQPLCLLGNSLERIQQYLSVEQEPKPTPDGVPPAYWPASGHLVVEHLSARYSPVRPLTRTAHPEP